MTTGQRLRLLIVFSENSLMFEGDTDSEAKGVAPA
jgi:hypothetical protein